MIHKIFFIISHFSALLAFVAACFGLGMFVFRRALETLRFEHWLRFGLAVTFGLGIVIVILQFLAIGGALTVMPVLMLIVIGIGFAVAQWRLIPLTGLPWRSLSFLEKSALVLLIMILSRTILAPLHPPSVWDEVMYHLPHALQWKETGKLTVNMWLRYPWFPFNYDLLYSGALLLYDDIFTHFLHALAGWLCALMIFQVGCKFTDRLQASIAAVIWLVLTAEGYDCAYIDLGVALFVFAGTVAMWLCMASDQSRIAWLIGSFFLLGVAAGAKYQALTFLPLFAGVMIIYERHPRVIGSALVALMIPCLYWYARNALMTGDPFDPLGGPIFGFSDWNLSDYRYQVEDIHNHATMLPWQLWPALIVPILPETWRSKFWRFAVAIGGYSILIWYLMSGAYLRYLIPALPVLSIMAAKGWCWLMEAAHDRIHHYVSVIDAMTARLRSAIQGGWKRYAFYAVMTCVCLVALDRMTLPYIQARWREIADTEAARRNYLSSRISGYDTLSHLKGLQGVHAYQFGLEDAIYYAPQPFWGDWFGPGRYFDFAELPARDLACKLNRLGLNTLVVNHKRFPKIAEKSGFSDYFKLMFESQNAGAYEINMNAIHCPDK